MNKTPVSILQELTVAKHVAMPVYKIEEAPPSVGFPFQCSVTADEMTGLGYGTTKQHAKHNSAHNLLNRMGYALSNPEANNNVVSTLASNTSVNLNYIGKLNEFASRKGLPYPDYSDCIIPINGVFQIECRFASKISIGQEQTKKMAKQLAAKAMLELLQKEEFTIMPGTTDSIENLDAKKKNNMNRLTEEVIRRLDKLDLPKTLKEERQIVEVLSPKVRFLSLSDVISYLESRGHKCKIATINRNPYTLIMEIENTNCSSLNTYMANGKNNHCRIMGQGRSEEAAFEDLRSTAEMMIVNKFSFNVKKEKCFISDGM